MSDFSGEAGFGGMGLVVYGLGAFSRAFSAKLAATACMLGETFDLVVGLEEPGFNGRGGGARSGSELSHLCFSGSRLA